MPKLETLGDIYFVSWYNCWKLIHSCQTEGNELVMHQQLVQTLHADRRQFCGLMEGEDLRTRAEV